MKLVVLSDIHSHSIALDHLLNHLKGKFPKEYKELRFCVLGDVIGYGYDPAGCLRILKELDDQGMLYRDEKERLAVIGGNHEEAWLWCEERVGDRLKEFSGLLPQERFTAITLMTNKLYAEFMNSHSYKMSRTALSAILLNMAVMYDFVEDPAIGWYRSIIHTNGYGPLAFSNVGPGKWNLVLAHGTYDKPLDGELFPCDPEDPGKIERYVNTQKRRGEERVVLLHGHTHVPLYFSTGVSQQPALIYNDVVIEHDAAVTVINPGSVGLPRDRDRRPSAALLEFGEESLRTTFIRDGPEDLHQIHIKQLKAGNYPVKIMDFVLTARTKRKLLAEECEQLLQERAGRHWTLLDDQ